MDVRNNYPGPGAYNSFSEFGMSSKAMPEEIKKTKYKKTRLESYNNNNIKEADMESNKVGGFMDKEDVENEAKEE